MQPICGTDPTLLLLRLACRDLPWRMATARAARARYPWTPCYFRSSEQASDVDSRNVQLDAALEPHLFNGFKLFLHTRVRERDQAAQDRAHTVLSLAVQ